MSQTIPLHSNPDFYSLLADSYLRLLGRPLLPHLPLEANVMFMTVMASHMPFIGRG